MLSRFTLISGSGLVFCTSQSTYSGELISDWAGSSSFARKMLLGISTQKADDASVSTSSVSSVSTFDSIISFKPISHTPPFAKSKYHSFLESLHVIHPIGNMKGTAGRYTVQSLSI